MKKTGYLILSTCIIAVFVFSCEKDKNKDNANKLVISGKYLGHSECKSGNIFFDKTMITSDTLSCVEYSFNNTLHKLTIKHVNAGFNCCPDSIYCTFSYGNDTIRIEEIEQKALCECNCLYDLNFELNGITSEKYNLKLIEPYIGDQQPIYLKLDLTKDTIGSFCVTRKQYPWGEKLFNN
jgi:hypothetical protein